MTQTMLERAARALSDHFICDWETMSDYNREMILSYARAVLMAVRVPSEAMSQAVRTTEGWEDMIDFVLNEPQP